MFLIAQIPFVDMRLLTNEEYRDCFFPNKFDTDFDKSLYYRFLGQQRNRNNSNDLPLFERQFFDSKRLLSLEPDNFKGGYIYCPQLLFSRFFEEQQCFHFDIGIRQANKTSASPNNLNLFSKDFLESPIFHINKRFKPENKVYNLIGLEKELREIYLYATASKRIQSDEKYTSQIILGFPALFIIYDQEERHSFGNAKQMILENGLVIHHELTSIRNVFVDVWYIGKKSSMKQDQDLRNIRIYLSKLHSYKESTRLIINYLTKKGSDNIDRGKITTFLEGISTKIDKEKYYSYSNNKFWDMAFCIDNQFNYASWDEIKNLIYGMLRNYEINQDYYFKEPVNKINQILNTEPQLSEQDKNWIRNQMEELIDVLQQDAPNQNRAQTLIGHIQEFAGRVLSNPSIIIGWIEVLQKVISIKNI